MKNINELRKELNVTQEQLASYVGVTTSSISQYENGSRTPSLNTAKKIASYFNVPVESINLVQRKSSRGKHKTR